MHPEAQKPQVSQQTKHGKVEEAGGMLLSTFPREPSPADPLVSNIRPPDCERMDSGCGKPPACGALLQTPRKGMQHPSWEGA